MQTKQNLDFLSKYMEIMDRLWSLTQSIMRSNMEYTLRENEQLKKVLTPHSTEEEGDDLPF